MESLWESFSICVQFDLLPMFCMVECGRQRDIEKEKVRMRWTMRSNNFRFNGICTIQRSVHFHLLLARPDAHATSVTPLLLCCPLGTEVVLRMTTKPIQGNNYLFLNNKLAAIFARLPFLLQLDSFSPFMGIRSEWRMECGKTWSRVIR